MFKKFSFSLPLQLVAVIFFVLFFGSFLPESIIRVCYTFSLIFKEVLNFSLPFIIFAFVLTGILSFKKNAPIILALLMSMIFFSNALVAIVSYIVAYSVIPIMTQDVNMQALQVKQTIAPFFIPSFPSLFRSEYVLLFSLVLGIVLTIIRFPSVEKGVQIFKQYVEYMVNRCIIPLLPLYVLGFFLKNYYEGIFELLFQNYGATFILIVVTQILYILFFYSLAAGFSIQKAWLYIKNASPSYFTAFSTMSSAATIPITVETSKKNTNNTPLSQMAVPIMANMHLIGDAIITPLLTLVTLVLFTGYMPDFISYMVFVFYFCIAMFAVSGIPGGGILVVLPILRAQFGFTPGMEGVVTALYFLLDSFGTGANVMGDGALIIIVNKILKKLKLSKD